MNGAIPSQPSRRVYGERREGILVVRRWWAEQGERARIEARLANAGHSITLVREAECYRGIDGWIWPDSQRLPVGTIKDGLVPFDRQTDLDHYIEFERAASACDVIGCRFGATNKLPVDTPFGFQFAGFDYGYFPDQFSTDGYLFSSVLNEVLFGFVPDMQPFRSRLNRYQLFSNLADTRRFEETRDALTRGGTDLEAIEEGEGGPIAIYVRDS